MNKRGFALTETLVVVVFLVTIFTFIYVSIIPLIGKYEDGIDREGDIDIVYKLYHLRKILISDSNRVSITSNNVKNIKCSDLDRSTFCNELVKQMLLKDSVSDNYVFVYAKLINESTLNSISNINKEIFDYAKKHQNEISGQTVFLLDTKIHTVVHLSYGYIE